MAKQYVRGSGYCYEIETAISTTKATKSAVGILETAVNSYSIDTNVNTTKTNTTVLEPQLQTIAIKLDILDLGDFIAFVPCALSLQHLIEPLWKKQLQISDFIEDGMK